MLEVAKGGTLKTKIMYKANLSFAQPTEYLSLLVKLKLLQAISVNGKNGYKITLKGLQYLQSYKEISNLLNAEVSSKFSNLLARSSS